MAMKHPKNTTKSDHKAKNSQRERQNTPSVAIDPAKVRPGFDAKITQMMDKMEQGLDYLATR